MAHWRSRHFACKLFRRLSRRRRRGLLDPRRFGNVDDVFVAADEIVAADVEIAAAVHDSNTSVAVD